MAIHSKVRIYIHLIWGTHHHERILIKSLRLKLFQHILDKAQGLNITIYKMNIQPEHLHILLNLPANKTISEIVRHLKGESANWINKNELVDGKFRWQRGYGVYSVSASQVGKVEAYIQRQDLHHSRKTFTIEYEEWVKQYGVRKEK